MSIGFVYAGQGSQHIGMGKDFYDNEEMFKNTLDMANKTAKEITNVDISKLSFEGTIEELSMTKYTQPAMVAFAIGVTKLLHEVGIKSDYCCGLSLGEYSALYEAGVLNEEETIKLVSKRGKFMTEASENLEVKMSAVLGADREKVIECCKKVTAEDKNGEIVSAANFNCPGQIVISGNAGAVEKAEELLKENGAKRIIPLKVSGPFHTALMKPAGDKLSKEFKNTKFKAMNSKVIFNCLGREKNEEEEISSLLEKQVQSSVYLEDSIKYMALKGVDKIIEIGPGNAISKFVKKTAPEINVYSIDTLEDFYNLKEEIKKWA